MVSVPPSRTVTPALPDAPVDALAPKRTSVTSFAPASSPVSVAPLRMSVQSHSHFTDLPEPVTDSVLPTAAALTVTALPPTE